MKKIALSLFVVAASGAYVWSQAGTETADALSGLPLLVDDAGAAPMPPSPAATGDAPAAAEQFAPVDPSAPQDGNGATTSFSRMAPRDLTAFATAFATDDLPTMSVPSESPPLTTPTPAAPPPPTPITAETPPPVEIPIPRPRPAYRPPVANEPPRRQQAPGNGVTRAALTLASGAMYADGNYTGPMVDAYYGLVQIEAIVQNGRLASIKVLRYPSDRRTSRFINRIALPRLHREVVRAQSARVNIISGATLTSEAFIQSLDGALRQARA